MSLPPQARWGSWELVAASRLMLADALRDPHAQQFLLLSEAGQDLPGSSHCDQPPTVGLSPHSDSLRCPKFEHRERGLVTCRCGSMFFCNLHSAHASGLSRNGGQLHLRGCMGCRCPTVPPHSDLAAAYGRAEEPHQRLQVRRRARGKALRANSLCVS